MMHTHTQKKHIDQQDRIESPEKTHTYDQLIYNKGGTNIQWRKESLQQVLLGNPDSYMYIN